MLLSAMISFTLTNLVLLVVLEIRGRLHEQRLRIAHSEQVAALRGELEASRQRLLADMERMLRHYNDPDEPWNSR